MNYLVAFVNRCNVSFRLLHRSSCWILRFWHPLIINQLSASNLKQTNVDPSIHSCRDFVRTNRILTGISSQYQSHHHGAFVDPRTTLYCLNCTRFCSKQVKGVTVRQNWTCVFSNSRAEFCFPMQFDPPCL